MFKIFALFLMCSIVNADLLLQQRRKGATLKPLSACCDIPELGDSKHLAECSNPKLPGPIVNADLLLQQRRKGATLKPLSACCDIPELGDSKHLAECSNPKLPGPCNDVQCVFEKSGFLIDKNTLNKDAYRTHLKKWSEAHSGWSQAVDRAIADCVDKDLRQYLDYSCKAYDVFTCTGIAMLKKCPESAWKC